MATSFGGLFLYACGGGLGRPEDPDGSPSGVPSVIHDNDEVIDVYTDDYVMALAGAGRIELIGMVTSSTTEPFNPWVSREDLRRMREDRAAGVAAARAIGITGIPDPVSGPDRHLVPPETGRIGDTEPIGSVGSRLVVETAATLPTGAALHLVMGGPLTLAADAFLLDPSIADRVVVHWLGGRTEGTGSSAPLLREDPDGGAVVVLRGDREVATEEWWRTILAAMARP